jgi:hypothetical protein
VAEAKDKGFGYEMDNYNAELQSAQAEYQAGARNEKEGYNQALGSMMQGGAGIAGGMSGGGGNKNSSGGGSKKSTSGDSMDFSGITPSQSGDGDTYGLSAKNQDYLKYNKFTFPQS